MGKPPKRSSVWKRGPFQTRLTARPHPTGSWLADDSNLNQTGLVANHWSFCWLLHQVGDNWYDAGILLCRE
jgi:hypothetical protein